MIDIIIEFLRAFVVLIIVCLLSFNSKSSSLKKIKGWKLFIAGFWCLFFGMMIDITDNFESLNQLVIIGDTKYQALIEKILGYLLGFSLIAIGVWSWIPKIIELENRRKKELVDAEKKIKILSGFLSTCSNCKKIRDDDGEWRQMEYYIRTHSEAEFSHGMCPECIKKLYPNSKISE